MKRVLTIFGLAVFAFCAAFAQDFVTADALHDTKKLGEELALLKQSYNPSDPQAAVVYRMLRSMQQIAVDLPANKGREKIAKLDEAIEFGKPLIDTAKGSARDRAKVIYWYSVSMSQKGNAKGVLNSLFMVPEVRALCDKAIAIDPAFGDPYYLKAILDDKVPAAAGGDKNRMAILYAKAIECDPVNVWYLVDSARALKARNKNAAYNKDGTRGVPAGKADLEYAKEIAKKAYAAFAALPNPSIDQQDKMKELKEAGL
jgi:hypothetical protein